VVVILAAGIIVQHLPSTITGNSIYLPTPSSNSNPMSLFSPLSLDADRNDRVSCDYYYTTCGVPFLLLLGRGEGGQRTTTCGTTTEPDNTDVDVAQHTTTANTTATTTIRIRRLKRGRTRRRRASRKRASIFVRENGRLLKHGFKLCPFRIYCSSLIINS